MILCINTATTLCSVAIGHANVPPAGVREIADAHAHSTALAPMVEQLMRECGISMKQLRAVAVNKGPGSYTGLRIGVSLAKGICYALSKPLLAIGSLEAMAQGVIQQRDAIWQPDNRPTLLCPMIDARRMEIYTALYTEQLQPVSEVEAKVIEPGAFGQWLSTHRLLFFGDGSAKCRTAIDHPNATFIDGIEPSAAYMLPLAHKKLQQGNTEDVAYFEPHYLKDFIAIKGKNKVLSGL